MGIVLRKLKDYERSESCLLDALSKRTAMMGKDHWHTLDISINVAVLYFECGRLEEV